MYSFCDDHQLTVHTFSILSSPEAVNKAVSEQLSEYLHSAYHDCRNEERGQHDTIPERPFGYSATSATRHVNSDVDCPSGSLPSSLRPSTCGRTRTIPMPRPRRRHTIAIRQHRLSHCSSTLLRPVLLRMASILAPAQVSRATWVYRVPSAHMLRFLGTAAIFSKWVRGGQRSGPVGWKASRRY